MITETIMKMAYLRATQLDKIRLENLKLMYDIKNAAILVTWVVTLVGIITLFPFLKLTSLYIVALFYLFMLMLSCFIFWLMNRKHYFKQLEHYIYYELDLGRKVKK